MSDKDIVFSSLKKIYMEYQYQPSIIDSFFPAKTGSIIGEKSDHCGGTDYPNDFEHILYDEKKNKTILNDDSFFSFFFLFDESGKITEESIQFLPNFDSEILRKKYETDDLGFLYHRFDYTPEVPTRDGHPQLHLHIGLCKENTRYPVAQIVYPADFLNFIFENVYSFHWDLLEKLINEEKAMKTIFLSDIQKQKPHFSFHD